MGAAGGRGESRLSDQRASVLQSSNCHKKIDELFSGKLYLIGIAAIVVAVIMVSVTAWCPAVVGWGKAASGWPGPVPAGLDPSLSAGCPAAQHAAPALCSPAALGRSETEGFIIPPVGQDVRAGAQRAR